MNCICWRITCVTSLHTVHETYSQLQVHVHEYAHKHTPFVSPGRFLSQSHSSPFFQSHPSWHLMSSRESSTSFWSSLPKDLSILCPCWKVISSISLLASHTLNTLCYNGNIMQYNDDKYLYLKDHSRNISHHIIQEDLCTYNVLQCLANH